MATGSASVKSACGTSRSLAAETSRSPALPTRTSLPRPGLAKQARACHIFPVATSVKLHGHFSAGEVGELAGVTGNTIGQWARWGYIRASQSDGEPHVYSVEDIAEAAMVKALLDRGISHMQVRRAIAQLSEYGDWPLSEARLATT